MGNLVKELQRFTHEDPELGADLVEALRLRNHLAHSFWRERADDFCTEEGRARMIAYLIETRNHFTDVDQRLTTTIGTQSLQESGMTSETINAWYQDMLRQIESGECNLPLSMVQSQREHLLSRLGGLDA
jgi:hypothetical protein